MPHALNKITVWVMWQATRTHLLASDAIAIPRETQSGRIATRPSGLLPQGKPDDRAAHETKEG